MAAKHHRARARDRRLPRLGAARANTAGRLSAGAMGTTVRLAGRRQAALSTVAAAAAAQRDQLRRGVRRRCDTSPGVYTVSGADLARQVLQRAGRSMSAPQPSMPHRTTGRGVVHAGSARGPSLWSALARLRIDAQTGTSAFGTKAHDIFQGMESSARDSDRSWRHPRDLRLRGRKFTPCVWQYQPSRRCGKWYGAYTGRLGISENRGVSQQSRGSRP